MRLGAAQTSLQILMNLRRTVDINPFYITRQAATGQQTHQAENMVAVHVGDKYPSQLTDSQVAAQELVLSSFPAVKQPDLCLLG